MRSSNRYYLGSARALTTKTTTRVHAIRDPARRQSLARRAQRVSAETGAILDLWSAELSSRLTDVEARLADRDSYLAGVEARLAQRDRDLTDHDTALADRDRDLAELVAALATVESTRTWRLRNRLLALRLVRAVAARRPATR